MFLEKFRDIQVMSVVISILTVFVSCNTPGYFENLESVNPMIGTAEDGRIRPVAVVPFGMIQLGPDTRLENQGYHYEDDVIIGFSHIHKSGAGCGDMLDLLFMPTIGPMDFYAQKKGYQQQGYESMYRHENEKAVPGKYSIKLDNDVQVDLTATKRCGFHRYQFPESDRSNIIIDLVHSSSNACTIYPDENHDTVTHAALRVIPPNSVEGYRVSTGTSPEQHVYFYAEFSQPFDEKLILDDYTPLDGDAIQSLKIRSVFRFKTNGKNPLLVKVGVSPVSIDGARKNLKKEIPGWDFDQTVDETRKLWADELNKFKVKTTDKNQKVLFYSSLYNALMYPALYCDVDGKYRGPDHQVHQADGFEYMAQISSIWDTFRAQNPLISLINPRVGNDHVRTFLEHYKHFGQLPIYLLNGNEVFAMLGYHSMPIIADAYYKGLRDYDAEAIFEAMKASADKDTFGYTLKVPVGTYNYKKYGYIPYDTEYRSVSSTLEYAYDDWCIAQMAKMLGKEDDYSYYLKRSKAYQYLFDKESGFMRAKNSRGEWFEPFDPLVAEHHKGNYVEGNAWQWTFFVPHDPEGLIELYDGENIFADKIDELFRTQDPNPSSADSIADMSGLIGQYAHGNEPSHHIPYFYNYVGMPWKTQEKVNEILTTMYRNAPDGLSGNDDTGQLTAWYVFGALGFYPVRHGTGEYAIGAPLFDRVEFTHTLTGNPKTLTIEAQNKSEDNIYVQSLKINGKPYHRCLVNHSDIFSDHCTMVFVMGDKPDKTWGTTN